MNKPESLIYNKLLEKGDKKLLENKYNIYFVNKIIEIPKIKNDKIENYECQFFELKDNIYYLHNNFVIDTHKSKNKRKRNKIKVKINIFLFEYMLNIICIGLSDDYKNHFFDSLLKHIENSDIKIKKNNKMNEIEKKLLITTKIIMCEEIKNKSIYFPFIGYIYICKNNWTQHIELMKTNNNIELMLPNDKNFTIKRNKNIEILSELLNKNLIKYYKKLKKYHQKNTIIYNLLQKYDEKTMKLFENKEDILMELCEIFEPNGFDYKYLENIKNIEINDLTLKLYFNDNLRKILEKKIKNEEIIEYIKEKKCQEDIILYQSKFGNLELDDTSFIQIINKNKIRLLKFLINKKIFKFTKNPFIEIIGMWTKLIYSEFYEEIFKMLIKKYPEFITDELKDLIKMKNQYFFEKILLQNTKYQIQNIEYPKTFCKI